MSPDPALATLSNSLTDAATALYTFAALAFAAIFAYRTSTTAEPAPVHERVLVAAGAGGTPPAPARPAPRPAEPRRVFTADSLGRYAIGLTVIGWTVQLAALATRGAAAGHVPWANMFEFVCAVTFAAVTALLVLFTRKQTLYLGAFVMFPVVLALGLATTTLHTPVSPLQPSLDSYWLAIHVLAAIVATGGFTVATALTTLHLYRGRTSVTPEHSQSSPAIAALAVRLPPAAALERLARQTITFAFPVWTFAIIAGAIWADNAWGRYWGWDPKETWAFITWIVYAAYLHAQRTRGWSGRKAAVVAIVGYGCLLFNLIGINIWGSGLHSYAGI
ncbi:c-type cytochrome biogenesis protein CcsB [Actinomadura sp. KC345]|uniref:c-type cytochrome biogenesis protein CcsB n=1 Tax=Actinomadura sp. KC345 TaxID=2530371 RepID=UPI00105096E6|nr:c-type cytochrome biogenesis protein CcsB [Actinomadura sp. KC345]TDC55292.1 c-type cytochrome biogenesis protein CcsB [Actinomadura sp. KC345]